MPNYSRNHISSEQLLNLRTPLIAGYVANDQSTSGNDVYWGWLDRDGNWYIQKQTTSGNDVLWRFVKGSGGYATAWTNRTTLSYDYYDAIFA